MKYVTWSVVSLAFLFLAGCASEPVADATPSTSEAGTASASVAKDDREVASECFESIQEMAR